MPAIDDLKQKTDDQLQQQLGELKREQFNLRFQSATNQLEKPSRVREVRRTIGKLRAPYASLPADDPRHAPLESEFRALCRAIDRLADAAKHARTNSAPAELGARLGWAIDHAVSCLRSLDANLFGRRYPVQTHERSKAEPVYAALLVVIQHLGRLRLLVLEIDPGLDERLLEGMVRLEMPVDDRMRQPMA